MNKLNKNKTLKLVLAVIVAASLLVGSITLYQLNQPSADPAPNNTEDTQKIVNTGRTEITYKGTPGITSLEQLKLEASDVVTQTSTYGELVDSIEGHKGGTDGKYWSFYVNGEMAQVGAGAYIQNEGDVIEWKFQKL